MNTAIEVPTVWNRLAEAMNLRDSPTEEVWLSERASFRFGRLRSSKGLPEVASPVVGERGHIVVLQLEAISFIEQFLGKKKVSSGYYPVGAVNAINLQEEPSVLGPTSVRCVDPVCHARGLWMKLPMPMGRHEWSN